MRYRRIRRDLYTGELRVSVTLFGLSTHLRPLGAQGLLDAPKVGLWGGSRRPVVLYPRSPVPVAIVFNGEPGHCRLTDTEDVMTYVTDQRILATAFTTSSSTHVKTTSTI